MIAHLKPPQGAHWAKTPVEIFDLQYRFDHNGYRTPDVTRLHTIQSDCLNEKLLSDNNVSHGGPYARASIPSWSADGQKIYVSLREEDGHGEKAGNTDILSYRIADGQKKHVTDFDGNEFSPLESPDGKYIAYLGWQNTGSASARNDIFIIPKNGGEPINLTGAYDRDVGKLSWLPSGAGLIFTYTENGKRKSAIVNLKGERRHAMDDVDAGDRIYVGYSGAQVVSVSADGERFATALRHADRPSEIYVGMIDVPSDSKRQLSHFADDVAQNYALASTEEIWVPSTNGDHKIQAWVIKPADFDKSKTYPLLLEVHGGPYADYGGYYAYDTQVLANAGMVVVVANPRGSRGYGKDFMQALDFKMPVPDGEDLMDVVHALEQKQYIDKSRLYIAGGSGGGMHVTWAIGQTQKFRAAVAYYPLVDWESFILTADNPYRYSRVWGGKYPWEKSNDYRSRSPLTYAHNVRTPTLIITGEQDFRTPISQSEMYYTALKLNDVNAALIRVPDEAHGLAKRPSNIVRRFEYMLAWFRRHGGLE